MSHGDKVAALPPGFKLAGSSRACAIAAMADESRRFYAVQFHPEVTHTKQGAAILARFAHDICGCGDDWNMSDYAGEAIAQIRAQVGADEVILGLSGGVDSSVAAALIHKAIGAQLICVFVDHGLLRQNEAEQVMDTFARNLGVRVIHVDAAEEMFAALAGVDDPERKRRIIGRLFVDVFQREAAKLAEREVAGAGNDLSRRDRVGGCGDEEGAHDQVAPQRRRPARDAASEASGAVARALQGRSARARPGARLPREMVWRHPFPGPGLGVRILGAVTREHAALLRRADAIFIDELRQARDGDGGAGTTSPRRRSRCSCRCARSA